MMAFPESCQNKGPVPSDILLPVLEIFEGDYCTLYLCSLVNREFNEIATKLLYSRVVLAPPFRPGLNLKDPDGLSECGQFVSSCLLRNAKYTKNFEINGFLSPRSSPRNTIGTKILHAVQSYHNLNAIHISPTTYPTGIFTDVLNILRTKSSIRHLTVNSACTDDDGSSALVTINGLQHLTLVDPTRAVLNKLPEWLSRLSWSLTELHLKDNCGSITPAVLRSFTPHLRRGIRSITLGLSYSLTDDDVFSFLGELPKLTSVQLQYYLQLKIPAPTPRFPHLNSFTARYKQMHTRDEVNRFCAWVRRAICSSHSLQTLRLISDHEKSSASISFDGLINHLATRHSGTLRILDLESAFIGGDALKQLCVACIHLEDLAVGIAWNTLQAFSTQRYASAMSRLHRISFTIRNAKHGKVVLDTPKATDIIMQGPQLRRLAVNGMRWEGSWETTNTLQVTFVVREIARRDGRHG